MGLAAGMAHVEALDSCRRMLQVEELAQRIELPAQVHPTCDPLLQRQLRVVDRHRNPAGPVATHVAADPDPAARLLPDGLFQHVEPRDGVTEQDLVGNRAFPPRAREVVLREERAQQLLLVSVRTVCRAQRARPQALPVADDE